MLKYAPQSSNRYPASHCFAYLQPSNPTGKIQAHHVDPLGFRSAQKETIVAQCLHAAPNRAGRLTPSKSQLKNGLCAPMHGPMRVWPMHWSGLRILPLHFALHRRAELRSGRGGLDDALHPSRRGQIQCEARGVSRVAGP